MCPMSSAGVSNRGIMVEEMDIGEMALIVIDDATILRKSAGSAEIHHVWQSGRQGKLDHVAGKSPAKVTAALLPY